MARNTHDNFMTSIELAHEVWHKVGTGVTVTIFCVSPVMFHRTHIPRDICSPRVYIWDICSPMCMHVHTTLHGCAAVQARLRPTPG